MLLKSFFLQIILNNIKIVIKKTNEVIVIIKL